MKIAESAPQLPVGLNVRLLADAISLTNSFLIELPNVLAISTGFYELLNHRNLSGLIGEALKHAIAKLDSHFFPNPHPDGRPDVLNFSDPSIRLFFESECLHHLDKSPLREMLAPFKHGGIEIKCTSGSVKIEANLLPVGRTRAPFVTGLTFWAHHAHNCELLGIYYDYDAACGGLPQIKAAFFCNVDQSDWRKVSIGNPLRKKTSNTSLNDQGNRKLYSGLVVYDDSSPYVEMLRRLEIVR